MFKIQKMHIDIETINQPLFFIKNWIYVNM